QRVLFNGDGYSDEWKLEAARRGLPNLVNSVQAFEVLSNENKVAFLLNSGVYRQDELNTRYSVLIERYNMQLKIEFATIVSMVNQYVLPSVIDYRLKIAMLINSTNIVNTNSGRGDSGDGRDGSVGHLKSILNILSNKSADLFEKTNKLDFSVKEFVKTYSHTNPDVFARKINEVLLPLFKETSGLCSELEELVADEHWVLPKYYDMLFLN
ncbi:MAG: hypothetical protein HQK53_15265, partial [Oligoflexia bacterium]|nr:hypothetical protein [Oligoflexia bacterium]